MMAESGGWPDEARPFFGAGDECQLVINFPLAARLLSSISTKYLPNTADLLSPIPDNCRWAVFLTNHDSVDLMFLTDENEKQTLRNKVDPSGNFTSPTSSGFSARLAEICQGNKEDIIWATRELLSQPGTPIIYYGNELGMRNQSLTPKTQDTRIYVRGQFDWEEVDRQKSDPNSVFNAVRTLIRNR
jgi:maltose alpha-D-glucosyltransferase/alpha-amylase